MIEKITFLLVFFILSTQVQTINAQTTFEWITAVNNGNNITETIDGITATFTGTNDETSEMYINDPGGYGGSSNNVIWELTLTTSVSFNFSQPVDVASILALNGNGLSNDYTFIASGGNNDTVTVAIIDGFAPPVNLNWTNVTSFTVTAPIINQFGFDNLIINDSTVSISENTLEGVKVFPNPVKNYLYLENVKNIVSAKVYNISGKLVLETTEVKIDFRNINRGVYFLQLKIDNVLITKRIIKE